MAVINGRKKTQTYLFWNQLPRNIIRGLLWPTYLNDDFFSERFEGQHVWETLIKSRGRLEGEDWLKIQCVSKYLY